jgi:hypothetical protein
MRTDCDIPIQSFLYDRRLVLPQRFQAGRGVASMALFEQGDDFVGGGIDIELWHGSVLRVA